MVVPNLNRLSLSLVIKEGVSYGLEKDAVTLYDSAVTVLPMDQLRTVMRIATIYLTIVVFHNRRGYSQSALQTTIQSLQTITSVKSKDNL